MTTQAIPREEVKIDEGISAGVLLFFLVTSMTGSIMTANWADGLGIMNWAGIAGLALGTALAKLPVRGRVAHPFMLIAGAEMVAVLTTTLFPSILTFSEKVLVLQERVWSWTLKILAGGVGSDNLIFVIQLSYLAWIIGYLAAWFVFRRHQVWGAIVPTGVSLLLNLFYAAPQTGFYLGLFIFSALLLLARMNLHTMQRWWHRASIGYTSDITFDFLMYGTLFIMVLMIFAWVLPASPPGPSWLSALDPLQGPWQEIEDQFNRVFSTLRAVGRPAPTTFFGTTLAMGGPVNLGKRPVMDIKADAGRYWRAAVYDKYGGIGWINTHLDSINLGANDPRLGLVRDYMRVEITQTIKLYLPDQNLLYAQSEPSLFDRPVEVRYGRVPTSDTWAPVYDVALVRARRPMREGDTYVVVSAISVADEDSLRNSRTRYSDWIINQYLQLPDDLPQRVRTLAKEITAKYNNPYDQAAAIEKYLRTKIKYNDNINPPPPGRDGVDHLLFDRPEGYCNYYASAMVVMARAIGIPARVASGYSLGDYYDGAFHVLESNAHSWVEVYFPSYGWIEFEPTASKPEIERPKRAAPTPYNPDLDDAAAEARRKRQKEELENEGDGLEPGATPLRVSWWNEPLILTFAGGVAGLAVVGTLTFVLVKRMRWMARFAPAARVYEQMLEHAHWLGIRGQKHETPFERARGITRMLPRARGKTDHVAALYVREQYSTRTIDDDERIILTKVWDEWRAEWWRGFAVRIIQHVIAPFRAMTERGRAFLSRWRRYPPAPPTEEE